MNQNHDPVINELQDKNMNFQHEYTPEAEIHVKGQAPKIAVLTCADSRVVPEFIFQAKIGELFVVRVAGNVAVDETVIASLEYAVDHLNVSHVILLAHSHCGAVKAAEQAKDTDSLLLSEIQKSFTLKKDHVLANLNRQLQLLPQRSEIIKKAIEQDSLHLKGAIYHIENGKVDFL